MNNKYYYQSKQSLNRSNPTNNSTMMTIFQTAEYKQVYDFVKISTAIFDESHDVTHAVAVCKSSLKIAESFDRDMEVDIIMYASMLHDVCDHKYKDSIKEEELVGFIVDKLGDEKCARVMSIINNVSFSKQTKGLRQQLDSPDDIYLDIVSDADKLEAIGKIGIDRCIAYTNATGGTVPGNVVKHCHKKLLLLKDKYIVTPMGKTLAEPLHQVIQDYVDEFDI